MTIGSAPVDAAPNDMPRSDRRERKVVEHLEAERYQQAERIARRWFDAVVAYTPAHETDRFIDAAFRARLTRQLNDTPPAVRRRVTPFLLKHDTLARTLAFLIRPEETPGAVMGTMAKLIEAFGDDLAERPNLAAAMAVVHDRDLTRRINENTARAPDVIDLYRFYVDHERKMRFGLRDVPAELLVWVVDARASIEDLKWALQQYAGDPAVGRRFHDIEYDYAHFRTGRPKRVTREGFTLPNIREYGGVCADQAYFAVTVGKAIGVPTAYTTARGGQVGHAWVGFLATRGDHGFWNFDIGRYNAYQGVKGDVTHPQTGEQVPDSYVSLLGEMIGTKRRDRWTAVAMTDAARRLGTHDKNERQPVTPVTDESEDDAAPPDSAEPRPTDAQARLDLLETGLRANPGYARAWFVMTDMVERGEMSLAQIKRWAEVLQRLTGKQYPDFTLAVLKPMIARMADPAEQNALWEAAYRLVRGRADLAAEVRVRQGRLWEQAGEWRKAGRAYEQVTRTFADAGPFAVDALKQTERVLRKMGADTEKVLVLYESTWSRCRPPQGVAATFARQSNWYRIGQLYAERLAQSGRPEHAADVRQRIRKTLGL